jgi:signal transduction histidine kinase
LISQLDETLDTEQQEITTYARVHNALPEIIPTRDQYISYTMVDKSPRIVHHNVTGSFNKEGKDQYRELIFGINAGGKYYTVKVDKPLEETEDLLQVIILVTIAMIGIILLMVYIINRMVISRIWRPFYQTIEKVKAYHLSDQNPLKLDKPGIDEFALLNQSINNMTENVQHDYQLLKEFTGNAAHEMQTPLAIIRSKLEMLMQNEVLLQQQAQNIFEIEKAVNRLSRLHQSLLLLIKVENRQFALNEEVQLDALVDEKCAEYSDVADAKDLKIDIHTEPVKILFHQHLAEIILNNLLGNAIRYNKTGGAISIILNKDQLLISNTSDIPELDKEQIFQRFYRSSDAREEGSGLGLSIVKQICELAGYHIEYKYEGGNHKFILKFS